jgi:hypothetical protein
MNSLMLRKMKSPLLPLFTVSRKISRKLMKTSPMTPLLSACFQEYKLNRKNILPKR